MYRVASTAAQVAEELVISPRSVQGLLRSIYNEDSGKLMKYPVALCG
jgi:hypothetical protein